MQASAPSTKKWIAPLAIVGGLALLLLLSNRNVNTPTGQPVIYDLETYKREYSNAANSAAPLFAMFDNGDEISEAGKATLRKAAAMFDTVNTYLPNRAAPYLDSGRAYLAAGDVETADARLQQCLNNTKLEKPDLGPEGVADAKYLLSIVRGEEGRWPESMSLVQEAIKSAPNVPAYYVQRASIEVQLNQVPQARADVAKALTMNPGNKKALQLQLLLKQAK